mgnify:CR=1 FL=1|jgi:hypothetical protein
MMLKTRAKSFISRLDYLSRIPITYPFAMSRNEQDAFVQEVGRSSNYIEFGLGGSTMRALLKSKAVIHTVESDPE